MPLLFVVAFGLFSCKEDRDDLLRGSQSYVVATPFTTELAAFKAEAVAVTDTVPVQQSGRIYAHKKFIFVNDITWGFIFWIIATRAHQ